MKRRHIALQNATQQVMTLTGPASDAAVNPAGISRVGNRGTVALKAPHFSWTAVAGLLFAWNVVAHIQRRPFATDFFRRHPICTTLFVVGLTHHLAPRRNDDQGPLGRLGYRALDSVSRRVLRLEDGR